MQREKSTGGEPELGVRSPSKAVVGFEQTNKKIRTC